MTSYDDAKKIARDKLGKGASDLEVLAETTKILKKAGKLTKPKTEKKKTASKKSTKKASFLGGELHRINVKYKNDPAKRESIMKAYCKNRRK